jgi:tetratricopeptide (TPR) repeat protein
MAAAVTVLFTKSYRVLGQEPLVTDPWITEHYEVYGEDPAAGERIARDLEGRFEIYSGLFRFNPWLLAAPLRVRLIADTAAYDEYLVAQLGQRSAGALYLHYRQADRRELVINYGGPDWERTLPYQSFIQYLRSFVSSPPSWIEEGFAIYFSTLSTEGKEPAYIENLSWLERVKESVIPPVEDILLLGTLDATVPLSREDYSSLSWALVSFFLNSGNEDYFRSLLECFLLLSPEAGLAENSQTLARRIDDWNGLENLDRDYRAYIDARKTIPELMEAGRLAYGEGDFEKAEPFFTTVLDLRPGYYAPYYYLGLIAYGRGDWDGARQYYLLSLERGADEALLYYALGLNAVAAKQDAQASEYLLRAAAADPARYRERAAALLRRLPDR